MTTIPVDLSDDQLVRVTRAFGRVLNLGRDCTEGELRVHLMNYMMDATMSAERQAAIAELKPVPVFSADDIAKAGTAVAAKPIP